MEKFVLKRGLSVITIAAMMAVMFALPVLTDSSVQAATKKVKVTYKVNDGKFAARKYAKKKSYSKWIRKYEKLGKLPKVVRSGYVLRGWYTKKRGGKKVGSKTQIKERTVLYAKWMKKYSLNDQYYKYMCQEKTLEKWEEIYGKLTYHKQSDEWICVYKSASGMEIGFIYNEYRGTYEPLFIHCDVKTIVKNHTKKIRYETFLKKLGVNRYEKVGSSSENNVLYFKKSKLNWNVGRKNRKFIQPDDLVSIWDPALME